MTLSLAALGWAVGAIGAFKARKASSEAHRAAQEADRAVREAKEAKEALRSGAEERARLREHAMRLTERYQEAQEEYAKLLASQAEQVRTFSGLPCGAWTSISNLGSQPSLLGLVLSVQMVQMGFLECA